MKCPGCGALGSDVLQTRIADVAAIERRRECLGCNGRWTTDEVIRKASFTTTTGSRWTTTTGSSRETTIDSGQLTLVPPNGGEGGVCAPDSGSSLFPEDRILSKQSVEISNTMSVRRRRKHAPYTAEFLAFWAAYPKRVKKPLAALAWLEEGPPIDEVMAALAWQRRDPEWLKEGGQFIPGPAVYINQRRWEDERSEAPMVSAREARANSATEAFINGGRKR